LCDGPGELRRGFDKRTPGKAVDQGNDPAKKVHRRARCIRPPPLLPGSNFDNRSTKRNSGPCGNDFSASFIFVVVAYDRQKIYFLMVR